MKYDLGGLGSAYFDISKGSARREPSGGETYLEIEVEEDVKKKMEGMLTDFQATAKNTLLSITASADSTKELVQKLARDDGDLFASIEALNSNLSSLNRIITNIESGEGALGNLLINEETEETIKRFVQSLGDTSSELQPMVANLNQAIGNLDSRIAEIKLGISSFNEASSMLIGTVGSTDETIAGFGLAADQLAEMLRESELLVEGLQRHWLIRGFVKDPIEDSEGRRVVGVEGVEANEIGVAPAKPNPESTDGSGRTSSPRTRTSYRVLGKKR